MPRFISLRLHDEVCVRDGKRDFDWAAVIGACDKSADLAFEICGVPVRHFLFEDEAISLLAGP